MGDVVDFRNHARSGDPDARWKAIITYKRKKGAEKRTFLFEEIEDLHAIVEGGPDWNAIEKIVVKLNRLQHGEIITIERAETL